MHVFQKEGVHKIEVIKKIHFIGEAAEIMMKGSGYKAHACKRRQQSRNTSGLARIAVKKKKRGKGRTILNKKKKGNSKKKKKPTYRDINNIFDPKSETWRFYTLTQWSVCLAN